MAKPKIAVLAGRALFESFFDDGLQARLEAMAHWSLKPRAVVRSLAQCDALITTWDSPRLEKDLLQEVPGLRFIAHCGGEVKKKFAVELFSQMVITNTAEPMAKPTAELGAAILLASARDLVGYAMKMRRRSNRIYHTVHENGGGANSLIGREVGLIGFGRIGRALVDLLTGFDIRWRIYDPYVQERVEAPRNSRYEGLDEVLRCSSMLVLAAAATRETERLLNAKRLALLPNGATVINIARGSLIDLGALTQEVVSGRLRCALDVTDPDEPLPVAHPLRSHPGAILTPHVGGGGPTVRRQMASMTLDSLERHFAGLPPLHQITVDMLERMT